MNIPLKNISKMVLACGVSFALLEGSNFVTKPFQWNDFKWSAVKPRFSAINQSISQYAPEKFRPTVQKYFWPTIGLGIGALGTAGLLYSYGYLPGFKKKPNIITILPGPESGKGSTDSPSTAPLTGDTGPRSPLAPFTNPTNTENPSSSETPDPASLLTALRTIGLQTPQSADIPAIGVGHPKSPSSNVLERSRSPESGSTATSSSASSSSGSETLSGRTTRVLDKINKILSDNPEGANLADAEGRLPLHLAANLPINYDKFNAIMPNLLKLTTNPNACITDNDGNPISALNIVIRRRNLSDLRFAELLLERRVEPNPVCEDQFPPLFDATLANKPELVQLLLTHNADPNVSFLSYPNILFYLISSEGNYEYIQGKEPINQDQFKEILTTIISHPDFNPFAATKPEFGVIRPEEDKNNILHKIIKSFKYPNAQPILETLLSHLPKATIQKLMVAKNGAGKTVYDLIIENPKPAFLRIFYNNNIPLTEEQLSRLFMHLLDKTTATKFDEVLSKKTNEFLSIFSFFVEEQRIRLPENIISELEKYTRKKIDPTERETNLLVKTQFVIEQALHIIKGQ